MSGSSNAALGASAGSNGTTGSNNVYIGIGMAGLRARATPVTSRGFSAKRPLTECPFSLTPDNKLGTATSSKRFKQDIKPMDKASEALIALKPVTFRYKKEIDPTGTPQFGLVGEDVERVNTDLGARQSGNALQRTVRRTEHDAAQRVSQRAQDDGRTGSGTAKAGGRPLLCSKSRLMRLVRACRK